MIDFLKIKSIKAFHEILEIAERPDLLFSNDKKQYTAEARYNLYTIQKLNKLIKKNSISLIKIEQTISFIEDSWSRYLSEHYLGKSFVFYSWVDYQIPAIRLSVVSFYEGLELPFGCVLEKVNDISKVLSPYLDTAGFESSFESGDNDDELNDVYTLRVYSRKILT